MGFSIQNIVIMYWLKHHNLLKTGDSVLELGSQQINNDVIEHLESVNSLAKLFNVVPFTQKFHWNIKDTKYLESGMQHLPENAPFTKELYEHLGLKYACVDIDDHPHSIKLDLNYDSAPENHRGRYALVTNLGTTEHVMNQLNAFKLIHDLTDRNGTMVHSLPFQGFATHGLVNYTMKFFWLLIQSNQYRIMDVDISSWEKTYMPEEIVKYAKNNSRIFTDKQHVDKVKFQDTGMTLVLQKCHDAPFVPPLDAPVDVKTTDPIITARYGKIVSMNPTDGFLSRIKILIKKFFNRQKTLSIIPGRCFKKKRTSCEAFRN